jgi:hypothetical protein
MPSIDWYDLAERLGTITETATGWGESGGTTVAAEALSQILGDDELRCAVDYYVSRRPGMEMAKSVLQLLKPASAMDRCHEIFLAGQDYDDVSFAINLLQYVADPRVLERVPLYLASDNEGAQYWGIGIVDQLVSFGGVELEDARPVLQLALDHQSEKVRERARWIIDNAQT